MLGINERRKKGLAKDRWNRQATVRYYRAKEFAAPNYTNAQTTEVRTDFRSTVYWDGNIEVNNKGLAYVEFYNNDDVSSFRVTVEGVGVGMVGRAEQTFFTQLPFAMYAKAPAQVVFEDFIAVPLTLKNTTDKTITGNLSVKSPKGFKVLNVAEGSHTIQQIVLKLFTWSMKC